MNFKIIGENVKKKTFETSVLVPIRQDKRVYKLFECLVKQKYKNFVMVICNDSRKPCLKKEDFPKNLNYIYYHSPEEKYSTFDKLNFLIDKIETPFMAITESDCEPSETWLSDLIPIAKKEHKGVKGGEVRPIGCCTANLVFPSEILKKVKFDSNIPIVADYDLGMNLKKKGYKLDFYNKKGVVFHNLVTGKARFNRIIPCARDDVYMTFKYRSPKFLLRRMGRHGFYIFQGFVELFAYLIYLPYFFIRFLIKNN